MTERAATNIEGVRAVDEALARRGPSREASERVRRELQRRALAQPYHARLRWWPALAFVAGAVIVGAISLGGASGPPGEPQQAREPSQAEAASPLPVEPGTDAHSQVPARPGASCDPFAVGPRTLEVGDCVEFDGVRISALISASLSREDELVDLHAGEVLFEVAPRPHLPLRVHAGGTRIEVVGTRFVLHHLDDQGFISMLEGRVRVDVGDLRPRELVRGQRLAWAGPAPASSSQGPRAGAQPERDRRADRERDRDHADDELAALLEEVGRLRQRGEFEAAVERLRGADQQNWSERSRQLVSYEIGSLLERQLHDTEAACAHWAEHRRRYPGARHDESVARSMARMGCGG